MKAEEIIPTLRAMVAFELKRTHGLKNAETARLLSITPQAVTQYVKGARAVGKHPLASNERVKQVVKEYAAKIAIRRRPVQETELLDLAYEVLMLAETPRQRAEDVEEQARTQALRILRSRLAAEQEAAELFLSEAIKAKDEVVRLLFRQVASDSIRHADIMQAVISVVEKGLGEGPLPDPERLKQLQQHEEKSHIQNLEDVKKMVHNNLVKILLDSVEADEAKHDMIIEKLISLNTASGASAS
ncbi:MAG: hypothetical protein NZ570_00065 [Candidatus Caldarchaeum sp.]|nr:hypothetical protein [Candidatus Caldarchaeum sp.]MCS7137539.1 hypothetical protein [Candidatus Caldarchaeum sp.]MDW7978303.1 hypothetical protein [Candidatus Caldarchaeum sp.]MDW8360272.1 hypothetical protein [Candidatus Caldarchaeum sp.]